MDGKTLTANDILNKKFSSDVKGYDAREVDEFLDNIIASFETLEEGKGRSMEIADSLRKEISSLKARILDLEVEKTKLANKVTEFDGKNEATKDNIDLLNRIKALEKALYALGVNPTKIK